MYFFIHKLSGITIVLSAFLNKEIQKQKRMTSKNIPSTKDSVESTREEEEEQQEKNEPNLHTSQQVGSSLVDTFRCGNKALVAGENMCKGEQMSLCMQPSSMYHYHYY